jgi:hypothetical protein
MNQFSSAFIEALYNRSSDLEPWIQGLARSMSTVIRTSYQYPVIVDSEAYLGTAYSYETVFKMTRGYLGLPVALVLLSGVFLGASIWQTGRARVETSKSDPLPLLFAGVDAEVMERFVAEEKVGGYEKGKGSAVLRNVEGRWVFVAR